MKSRSALLAPVVLEVTRLSPSITGAVVRASHGPENMSERELELAAHRARAMLEVIEDGRAKLKLALSTGDAA